LDQATPPWRAFPPESAGAGAPGAEAPGAAHRPGALDRPVDRLPRWLAPALAALGGLVGGATAIAAIVLAVGWLPAASEPLPPLEPLAVVGAPEPAAVPAPVELVVDVAGAVANPGLHRLRTGDRVGDAIAAAGGYAPRADLAGASQTLNLAQPLQDGAKVLVPELGIDRAAPAGPADDGRIDLNRAGRDELESLPGIGPVTAGKIIDAREDGRFESVRELRSRSIVGEKVYEDIKGLVRAG
jgi:competence protein ComEA